MRDLLNHFPKFVTLEMSKGDSDSTRNEAFAIFEFRITATLCEKKLRSGKNNSHDQRKSMKLNV